MIAHDGSINANVTKLTSHASILDAHDASLIAHDGSINANISTLITHALQLNTQDASLIAHNNSIQNQELSLSAINNLNFSKAFNSSVTYYLVNNLFLLQNGNTDYQENVATNEFIEKNNVVLLKYKSIYYYTYDMVYEFSGNILKEYKPSIVNDFKDKFKIDNNIILNKSYVTYDFKFLYNNFHYSLNSPNENVDYFIVLYSANFSRFNVSYVNGQKQLYISRISSQSLEHLPMNDPSLDFIELIIKTSDLIDRSEYKFNDLQISSDIIDECFSKQKIIKIISPETTEIINTIDIYVLDSFNINFTNDQTNSLQKINNLEIIIKKYSITELTNYDISLSFNHNNYTEYKFILEKSLDYSYNELITIQQSDISSTFNMDINKNGILFISFYNLFSYCDTTKSTVASYFNTNFKNLLPPSLVSKNFQDYNFSLAKTKKSGKNYVTFCTINDSNLLINFELKDDPRTQISFDQSFVFTGTSYNNFKPEILKTYINDEFLYISLGSFTKGNVLLFRYNYKLIILLNDFSNQNLLIDFDRDFMQIDTIDTNGQSFPRGLEFDLNGNLKFISRAWMGSDEDGHFSTHIYIYFLKEKTVSTLYFPDIYKPSYNYIEPLFLDNTLSLCSNIIYYGSSGSVSYIYYGDLFIYNIITDLNFIDTNLTCKSLACDGLISIGILHVGESTFTENVTIYGHLTVNGTFTHTDNFTGSHGNNNNLDKSINNIHNGLIVSTNNSYINIDFSIYPTIDESLPYCNLTTKENDKSVFGVVNSKNQNNLRINSVGEGALWVCNINGNLENGDYITSSNIPGYGQKQTLNEGILCNFTVAKITANCEFNLTKIVKKKVKITIGTSGEEILEYDENNQIQYIDDLDENGNQQLVYNYNTRFINLQGNILKDSQGNNLELTQQEYESRISNNEEIYIACFIGCTYHCG